MPTKVEWQFLGGILLFLLCALPLNSLFDLLCKVRRTRSGKREKLEPPDRSVTR
jgi:hypothetical protein